MKKNIYNYQDIMTKKKDNEVLDVVSIYSFLYFVLSLLSLCLYGVAGNYIAVCSLIVSPSLLIGKNVLKKIRRKRYEDFDKNILFLENEEMLNQRVLDKTNAFENIATKRINNVIIDRPDGTKGFTINSIDKMSLDELRKLLEFIRIEEQLLKEEDINDEEKGYTKVLK